MKVIALFTAACALVVGGLGALLALAFRTPADWRAITVSAGVAVVVQALTFAAVRAAGAPRTLTAWGVGAAVRLGVLVVYGLAVVTPLGLPAEAALLSLASFFFATTLVETRLLFS